MTSAKELPELVSEFVDMSKQYLRQETLEPAKHLGRHAAFSIAGGIAFAMAALFAAVALLRLIIDVLPSDPGHRMWSGLGYVLTAVALAAIGGIVVKVASK